MKISPARINVAPDSLSSADQNASLDLIQTLSPVQSSPRIHRIVTAANFPLALFMTKKRSNTDNTIKIGTNHSIMVAVVVPQVCIFLGT